MDNYVSVGRVFNPPVCRYGRGEVGKIKNAPALVRGHF